MSRAAEQLVGLPDDAKLPGSSVLFSSQKLTTKTISRKRETIDVIGSGNLSIENEEEEEKEELRVRKKKKKRKRNSWRKTKKRKRKR